VRQEDDFFDSSFGTLRRLSWRNRRLGWLTDSLFDSRLRLNRTRRSLRTSIDASPVQDVLIVGIEVPDRAADIHAVIDALSRTRHRIEVALVKMQPRGKFENVNAAIAEVDLARFDWMVVVDDDIAAPPGLLDECLRLSHAAVLKIFQPAHRFRSYATFKLTQRRWNTLLRITRFVESGPLTGFHRDTFDALLPFPSMRWAWGLDVHWSEIARREGWNIGIVDSVPIRHLRPIAASYGFFTAMDEARAFLQAQGISRPKEDILCTVRAI
jgi:hypothetical protein